MIALQTSILSQYSKWSDIKERLTGQSELWMQLKINLIIQYVDLQEDYSMLISNEEQLLKIFNLF